MRARRQESFLGQSELDWRGGVVRRHTRGTEPTTMAQASSGSPQPDLSSILGAPEGPTPMIDVATATGLLRQVEACLKSDAPAQEAWFESRERWASGDTSRAAESVYQLCARFLSAGWEEPAWKLALLGIDQLVKASRQAVRRLHLGSALFTPSMLARMLGHNSAMRHYAALAAVADTLWEPYAPALRDGAGAAAHFLAARTSWADVEDLRAEIRRLRGEYDDDAPLHPESLWARRWLGSRGLVLRDFVEIKAGASTSYPDYILDRLDGGPLSSSSTGRGTLFEAVAGILFSVTPGFEVRGPYSDPAAEMDIVVTYTRDRFTHALLPEGYGLVECKYWTADVVGAPEVREFGSKCFLRNARFGVHVTKEALSGSSTKEALRDAELERRQLLARGVQILRAAEVRVVGIGLLRALRVGRQRHQSDRWVVGPRLARSVRRSRLWAVAARRKKWVVCGCVQVRPRAILDNNA